MANSVDPDQARQVIHIKCHALFSQKNNEKRRKNVFQMSAAQWIERPLCDWEVLGLNCG